MLVGKISQTGNKMDRISQYTKYLNNGKDDVVIEEEEILKPSEIKILVLTSATDSEEPTINRLEKVCKKRSIELHRISSDKAYASKKSESKENLIIYNYDGEGNSMEVNSNDNIVCIARRTVVSNKNAAIRLFPSTNEWFLITKYNKCAAFSSMLGYSSLPSNVW